VEVDPNAGPSATAIGMDSKIRRGTSADAEFLAWVMLSASRGHVNRGIWDLLIGADDAGCLEYLRRLAVAEPRSLCHYESFWIADVEGRPAAALCGFEFRAGGWATVAQAKWKVQRDLLWSDADFAASDKRMAPLWSCFLPDVGADWGIENVATRTEFRGQGLAQALLLHVAGEGRERGCKLAQIATTLGNNAALSVYQRCGFRWSGEKRCEVVESTLGAAGFVRLLREL